MASSLASRLHLLSKSAHIVLWHLSALAAPCASVSTTTRALTRLTGLHPQSVYVGLRTLERVGLCSLAKSGARGGWVISLFPGCPGPDEWPVSVSLFSPSAAGGVGTSVGPTEASAVHQGSLLDPIA